MMSKTAINWAAGLGVAAFVAAGAFALKYYDAWPGAARSPAPLVLQSAPAAAPAPPAAEIAATPAPSAPANVAPAAQAAATPAVAPDKAAPGQPRPAFDVVRIEPTGDAVIAGRASPLASVELRADGRVVAETNADGAGQFAILPPPFSAGGHRLQLAARLGGAPEVLSDAIGIDVPAAPSPTPAKSVAPAPASQMPVATKPVAAAPPPKAPPAETPKLAWLGAAPLTDATAAPRVSVLSVEASGTGRLEAKGAAEANKLVRLYLNNAFLAEATAGADGRWSLTVERGMTPGAYAIRADQIDRANGAVTARAEVPFTYPERPSAQQSAAAVPQPSASVTVAAKPAAQSSASLTVAAKPAPPTQIASASRTVGAIEPAATKPPAVAAAPAAPLVAMSESAKPSGEAPTPAPQPAAASPVEPAAPASEKTKPSAEAPAPAAPAPETAKPAEVASSAAAAKVPDQPLAPSAAAAEASASAEAETAAPATAKAPAIVATAPEKSADAVVQEIRTTKVVRGDSLWRLSEHFYGYGPRYRTIYEANATQIRNPRLIYPNQIFVVPKTN
jgi:nucleoid-associated protein YgaU